MAPWLAGVIPLGLVKTAPPGVWQLERLGYDC